jgi:hypothetical protein
MQDSEADFPNTADGEAMIPQVAIIDQPAAPSNFSADVLLMLGIKSLAILLAIVAWVTVAEEGYSYGNKYGVSGVCWYGIEVASDLSLTGSTSTCNFLIFTGVLSMLTDTIWIIVLVVKALSLSEKVLMQPKMETFVKMITCGVMLLFWFATALNMADRLDDTYVSIDEYELNFSDLGGNKEVLNRPIICAWGCFSLYIMSLIMAFLYAYALKKHNTTDLAASLLSSDAIGDYVPPAETTDTTEETA